MLGTRLGRPTVQKAGLEAKADLLSDCHLPGHSPPAQGGVLAIGAQTGTGQSSTRGKGNWETVASLLPRPRQADRSARRLRG